MNTPSRIKNLRITPEDGGLDVQWTAATYAPNGYSVRWRKRGPGTQLSDINTVTETLFYIPNLENGVSYVVRVDTRNVMDNGVEASTRVNGVGTPEEDNITVPNPLAFTRTIPDATLVVGVPFRIQLPVATGGTSGLPDYTLHPNSLPAGISFDSSGRLLHGTPVAPTSSFLLTWTASDINTNPEDNVVLTFRIAIVDAIQSPTKVRNLFASPRETTIDLEWTAATWAPGGYSVRWRKHDAHPSTLTTINKVDGASFSITNLEKGTAYFIRVDTYDGAGREIAADTKASLVVRTKGEAPPKPPPPVVDEQAPKTSPPPKPRAQVRIPEGMPESDKRWISNWLRPGKPESFREGAIKAIKQWEYEQRRKAERLALNEEIVKSAIVSEHGFFVVSLQNSWTGDNSLGKDIALKWDNPSDDFNEITVKFITQISKDSEQQVLGETRGLADRAANDDGLMVWLIMNADAHQKTAWLNRYIPDPDAQSIVHEQTRIANHANRYKRWKDQRQATKILEFVYQHSRNPHFHDMFEDFLDEM